MQTKQSLIMNKRIIPEAFEVILFRWWFLLIGLIWDYIRTHASTESRYILYWVWVFLTVAVWVTFICWVFYILYLILFPHRDKLTTDRSQIKKITWILNNLYFTTNFIGRRSSWINLELQFMVEQDLQVYTNTIWISGLNYKQILEFLFNYDSRSRQKIDQYMKRNKLIFWSEYILEWWFEEQKRFFVISISPM